MNYLDDEATLLKMGLYNTAKCYTSRRCGNMFFCRTCAEERILNTIDNIEYAERVYGPRRTYMAELYTTIDRFLIDQRSMIVMLNEDRCLAKIDHGVAPTITVQVLLFDHEHIYVRRVLSTFGDEDRSYILYDKSDDAILEDSVLMLAPSSLSFNGYVNTWAVGRRDVSLDYLKSLSHITKGLRAILWSNHKDVRFKVHS